MPSHLSAPNKRTYMYSTNAKFLIRYGAQPTLHVALLSSLFHNAYLNDYETLRHADKLQP